MLHKNIRTSTELKVLQTPEAKQGYTLSREIARAGKLNNELFLKLLQPYVESSSRGYRVMVPNGKIFNYNPAVLKDCSVLDSITVVGNAKVTHGYALNAQTNKSLVRSPHKVEGNLRLHFTPDNFEGMPIVTGNIYFNLDADKKNYIKYIAGSSYEEHEDLLNF
jgi:hypothetical protein